MPIQKPLELTQGMEKFVVSALGTILDDMNADLADKIVANTSMEPFTVEIGIVKNPGHPVLCVRSGISNQPAKIATKTKVRRVVTRVTCLIPHAGDDTSMNFEMAYEVSSDWVNTLFDADETMLSPTIDAGIIPSLTANADEGCEVGTLTDIFPYVAEDKTTIINGWFLTYTAPFSFTTDYSFP